MLSLVLVNVILTSGHAEHHIRGDVSQRVDNVTLPGLQRITFGWTSVTVSRALHCHDAGYWLCSHFEMVRVSCLVRRIQEDELLRGTCRRWCRLRILPLQMIRNRLLYFRVCMGQKTRLLGLSIVLFIYQCRQHQMLAKIEEQFASASELMQAEELWRWPNVSLGEKISRSDGLCLDNVSLPKRLQHLLFGHVSTKVWTMQASVGSCIDVDLKICSTKVWTM